MGRLRTLLAVIALVVATLLAPTATAGGYRSITLTFVRHAQSAGNASGLVDTSTPGPALTDLGRTQAVASALRLAPNRYDGIFASTMIRTQQTAQPMADTLHEPVTVLPGLHEVEAGVYEGQPGGERGPDLLRGARTVATWGSERPDSRLDRRQRVRRPVRRGGSADL